jgi:hypothetical protein
MKASKISKKEMHIRNKIATFEGELEASHGRFEKFRPLQFAWSFQASLIGLLERDRRSLQAKVKKLEARVKLLDGAG